MNSSQTPLPCTRIGWQRPSQRLKSPTTLTRAAFGAQTENSTPAMPVGLVHAGAEQAVGVPVATLAEQVHVEVRQLGREAVGVVADVLAVVVGRARSADSAPAAARPSVPFEQIGALDPLHRLIALGDGHGLRVRQQYAARTISWFGFLRC
jgi:hypothetical protein